MLIVSFWYIVKSLRTLHCNCYIIIIVSIITIVIIIIISSSSSSSVEA